LNDQVEILKDEIQKLKNRNEELEVSALKYQTLFEQSADAFSILNLETGKFTECNDSAIKMHGVESEDNLINLKVAKGFLKKLSIFPDVAKNGLECLNMFKEKVYDVILMGCQMPIMDGYEATKKIRALKSKKRPLIVALTASAIKEEVDKCYSVGMDNFLAKPLNYKSLRFILVDVLKSNIKKIS
jgi:CheY-like chemotaxis protein